MTNSIELLEDFKDLPEEVQTVISSFKYDDTLKEIHQKYKLHIDQAASLEKGVTKVIFGEIKPQELIPFTEKELHITAAQAREIVFDINEHLLMPIQNAMKALPSKEGDK